MQWISVTPATLVFFDANGEILYKVVGAPDAEQMVTYAKQASAVNEMKLNNSWKTNGDNFRPYLEALATHQPAEAGKIAAEYLRGLPIDDIHKAENWRLLATYVKDVNDPCWQYVLNNIPYFSNEYSDLAFSLETVGEVVLQNAIASKNQLLLSSKTDLDIVVKRLQGDSSVTKDQLQLWNTVVYLEKTGDDAGYAKGLNTFLKKYAWDNSKVLTYYASKILSGNYSSFANADAVRWAEQALKFDDANYVAHWVLAIGYSKKKDMGKSNLALQNFLRASTSDPQLSEKLNMLMYGY